jgi:uncharacterized protein
VRIAINLNFGQNYNNLKKNRIYLMGLVTLIGFPLPAFLLLHYREGFQWQDFLQLDRLELTPILLGIEFGLFYGVLAIALLSSGLLQKEKQRQSQLLKQLRLTLPDMLFLSFCAGFGEELLFRIGIQFYFGPEWTALLFVALHGYYDPRNWRVTLYGLLLTPFILLLGYSVGYFGIWFAIAAHTAYDVLLFVTYGRQRQDEVN